MDMNKTNSSIDENEESLVGEVLSDDEVREKKQAIAKWQHSPVGFGSYITKSNDLIQRTKYSLPRNEQKVLFMLMSKIDQKNDKDASKYYSITFNDFAKLTGVRTVDTTYALNLKETIENLENRTFWVKKEPGSKVYRSISWLQKGSEVDFDKKEIRLRFNQDIWKDIAQLTSNYTSYSIEYLLMMKSTYSMRVYEIILSYDNGNRDYGYTNGLVFQPVSSPQSATSWRVISIKNSILMSLKVCFLHPQRQRESPQRAKRKRIRHLPTRKSLTGKNRCLKSTRLLQSLKRMF